MHPIARRTIVLGLSVLLVSGALGWHLGEAPRAIVASAQAEDSCPEPNDTFQQACYLNDDRPLDAPSYISAADDIDAYRFEVADFNSLFVVDMPTGPAGYRVNLVDWNGRVLASSTDPTDRHISAT